MKPILAEDMRAILDRLDEYLVELGEDEKNKKENPEPEKGAEEPAEKDPSDDKPEDDKEPSKEKRVGDVLKRPAGLKKLVGSLNVQALVDFLEIPKEYHSTFRSAINVLRSESRVLSSSQSLALAIAFANALEIFQAKLPHVTSHGSRHMEEELDANKLQSYLSRDKSQPGSGTDGIDHMKKVIAAVDKHGTPDEKKELGLDEQAGPQMPVKIIAYNSGYGEKLADVAKDPKRHKEVMGSLSLGNNGQPILRFTEKGDSQVYVADWNPQYGWVADYD